MCHHLIKMHTHISNSLHPKNQKREHEKSLNLQYNRFSLSQFIFFTIAWISTSICAINTEAYERIFYCTSTRICTLKNVLVELQCHYDRRLNRMSLHRVLIHISNLQAELGKDFSYRAFRFIEECKNHQIDVKKLPVNELFVDFIIQCLIILTFRARYALDPRKTKIQNVVDEIRDFLEIWSKFIGRPQHYRN